MPQQMSIEDMASSAFRTFAFAGNVEEEPIWDHLSTDDQMRWRHLARQAEPVMLQLEGSPYRKVAEKLFLLFMRSEDVSVWESQEPRMKLIWQAISRHLAALLDSDDIEGPDHLERHWGEWVDSKMKGEP
jgi:hypothetical protein